MQAGHVSSGTHLAAGEGEPGTKRVSQAHFTTLCLQEGPVTTPACRRDMSQFTRLCLQEGHVSVTRLCLQEGHVTAGEHSAAGEGDSGGQAGDGAPREGSATSASSQESMPFSEPFSDDAEGEQPGAGKLAGPRSPATVGHSPGHSHSRSSSVPPAGMSGSLKQPPGSGKGSLGRGRSAGAPRPRGVARWLCSCFSPRSQTKGAEEWGPAEQRQQGQGHAQQQPRAGASLADRLTAKQAAQDAQQLGGHQGGKHPGAALDAAADEGELPGAHPRSTADGWQVGSTADHTVQEAAELSFGHSARQHQQPAGQLTAVESLDSRRSPDSVTFPATSQHDAPEVRLYDSVSIARLLMHL